MAWYPASFYEIQGQNRLIFDGLMHGKYAELQLLRTQSSG